MKPYLLRLHRWLTLAFALPLAVLIVTGLFLSFEPIAAAVSRAPGALTAQRVEELLARHDPDGKARGVAYRPHDGSIALIGGGVIDVATGEARPPGALARLMQASRPLHEHFVADLDWLVTASTVAMCVIAALGLLMGLPMNLRNTLSGWHKATAWFLSPLVILAPLTGLALAFGVTFAGPPPGESPAPSQRPSGQADPQADPQAGRRGGAPVLPLREAVKIAAQGHDLSNLIWLRARGPNMLARFEERGEARVYVVRPDGLTPAPRNVPRLMHEGNWAGVWSGIVNVVASLALALLLATGMVIWVRRRLRKPTRRRERAPA